MSAVHESRERVDPGGGTPVRRVGEAELIAAAGRLTGGLTDQPLRAGKAFVDRARQNGIDLSNLWASFPAVGVASQAALVVPQTGRTAMIFLSGPGSVRLCGSEEQQAADREAVVRAALGGGDDSLGDAVHLFQALPAPDEYWAIEAFSSGGMSRLGDLAYLKRPFMNAGDRVTAEWPPGVTVRRLGALDGTPKGARDRAALRRALLRTYEETLDCPGLCDLRSVDDVIESHISAGQFDRAHWWLIEWEGEGEGCVLLTPSFETQSLELVYMGLGPALRGKGLATHALRFAISGAQRLGLNEISCAVDLQNEPARAVYARLGFSEFARRVAFVRPSSSNPAR